MPIPAIVAAAPAAYSVPFTNVGGLAIVPVTIAGKGPYHFILDTGAGITVITPALASAIGATPRGSTVGGGMGAQQVHVQTLDLDRVSIGGAEQSGIATAIFPLPKTVTDQGSYGSIDGIVGYSFLRNYAVTIDYASGMATFASTFAPPTGIAAVPFELAQHALPIVRAQAGQQNGRFELDSGNNSVAVVTDDFARESGIAERYPNGPASAYAGVGGTVITHQVRIGAIELGGYTVHQVAADVSPAQGTVIGKDGVDGTFGYDLLSRFTVTIDYLHSNAYFAPRAHYDAYKPLAGTGIVPQREPDGSFVVAAVVRDSPAAHAGVLAGDRILAVDGRNAQSIGSAEFKRVVGTAPGSRVTYTLDSKSRGRFDVTLVTVDLLPRRN